MSRFFVLEGLDGSGKTTQISRLREWFSAKGLPCFATRQPSEGHIGALARAATQGAFSCENETFALLFAAEHCQHYHEKILPALQRGEYVICDRYYYSNLAYQGVDYAAVERITSYIQPVAGAQARKPDAVIFIDVPPDECMRRINASRSEISIFEAKDKLIKLRERYLTTFEQLRKTENIFIIETDASDENAVFDKIVNKISPLCSI